MIRTIDIDLLYQPLIGQVPEHYGDIYKRACAGDQVTVDTWRSTWLKNYEASVKRFGDLGERSYGKLHGINRHKPAIVVGSGPSLVQSVSALKENSKSEHPVLTISCLHNLGYMEDEGIKIDYYLSLDSGGVVIEDASEARNKDGQFYWEQTQDKTLIAYAASDPKLFDLWQGQIYLFNCLIPEIKLKKDLESIQKFSHYVSSGGNAGGACIYAAKAVFGSDPIMLVGMDYCFSYSNKFHSYHSKYDNWKGKGLGNVIRWPDCYGILRSTWPSYLNFKFFADYMSRKVPGIWINCSEGLVGSYPEGNLDTFRYMPLINALAPYKSVDSVFIESRKNDGSLESREELKLKDLFSNPKYEKDLVLY